MREVRIEPWDAGDDGEPLDPALETTFGLAGEEWVDHARRAVLPAPTLGRLGAYELSAEIGRGGQGEVYRAVQPGTGRPVAIKRLGGAGLRLGTRAGDRFAREVEAVTRLSHPNVVTVHSAEVIEGHAVLVMEWIDGAPISVWADRQWQTDAGSAPGAILEVFARVCDGVAHAHQRGVVHRDIKPSNVLVDASGNPRVLDFGIARLLSDERAPAGHISWTATGFAGTPAYAPPEQLVGRTSGPDTRGDVYSLGVLLYRLTTGSEAFGDGALAEVLDAVRRATARAPSQVRPGLSRDLDSIVLKAMSKEPASRYQTVEAFGADVRRLLSGYPVLAHPPGRLYAGAKFVGRHRLACASVGVATLAIAALAAVSTVQALRLGAQRNALVAAAARESDLLTQSRTNEESARREADLHRRTAGFLGSLVKRIDLDRGAETISVRALAEWAAAQLDAGALHERPEAEIDMRRLVGDLYRGLDLTAPALEQYQAGLDRARSARGERDPLTVSLHNRTALALAEAGRQDEALAIMRRVVSTAEEIRGKETSYLAGYLGDLGALLQEMNHLPEAEEVHRRALAIRERAPDAVPSVLASSLRNLGNVLSAEGRLDEARPLFERALSILSDPTANSTATDPSPPVQAARTLACLAALEFDAGRDVRAELLSAQAVEALRATCGETHQRTPAARVLHARALQRLDRHAEALDELRRAVEFYASRREASDLMLAQLRFRMGAGLLSLGREGDGRAALLLAVSRGAAAGSGTITAELRSQVDACAAALVECEYRIDATERLYDRLEGLSWLIDTPRSRVPAADDHPAP